MKITKQQLKKLIKEELQHVVQEQEQQGAAPAAAAGPTASTPDFDPSNRSYNPGHMKKVSDMALAAKQTADSVSDGLKSLKALLVHKGVITVAELQGKTQQQMSGRASVQKAP